MLDFERFYRSSITSTSNTKGLTEVTMTTEMKNPWFQFHILILDGTGMR